MLRRLLGASLLLALVAVLPTLTARAQNKDKMVPKDSSKLPAGDYTGILKTTPGSDRTFTLTIENKRLVAVPKGGALPGAYNVLGYPGLNSALNGLAAAQRHYVKAANNAAKAKGKSKASAVANLQTAAAQVRAAAVNVERYAIAAGLRNTRILQGSTVPNLNVVTTKDDYDFQAMETVKVRVLKLPEQFDEKGNPKKYTAKELAELKGKDKNLVGYESSLEKLETNQRVTVTLVAVTKKKLSTAPANKGNDKDKDKDKDKDDDSEKKMQVKLTVILDEADAAKGKGKKGN